MNAEWTDKSVLLPRVLCCRLHRELLNNPMRNQKARLTEHEVMLLLSKHTKWLGFEGVHQLCSAFISLVSRCLLSLLLCLAHMQGWWVWESDDSSVAHLTVVWPYLGCPEIHVFWACAEERSRHCRDIMMNSLLLSLSLCTIFQSRDL